MTFGIQVFNSAGAVQIVNSGTQFQVVSSGLASPTFDFLLGWRVDIPGDAFSGTRSLLIKPITDGKLIYTGTLSHYNSSSGYSAVPVEDSSTHVKWAIVDNVSAPVATSGYGFQVLNSSGGVAFSSDTDSGVVTTSYSKFIAIGSGGSEVISVSNAPYTGRELYWFYGSAERKVLRNAAATQHQIFFHNIRLSPTSATLGQVQNSAPNYGSAPPVTDFIRILFGVIP